MCYSENMKYTHTCTHIHTRWTQKTAIHLQSLIMVAPLQMHVFCYDCLLFFYLLVSLLPTHVITCISPYCYDNTSTKEAAVSVFYTFWGITYVR